MKEIYDRAEAGSGWTKIFGRTPRGNDGVFNEGGQQVQDKNDVNVVNLDMRQRHKRVEALIISLR